MGKDGRQRRYQPKTGPENCFRYRSIQWVESSLETTEKIDTSIDRVSLTTLSAVSTTGFSVKTASYLSAASSMIALDY